MDAINSLVGGMRAMQSTFDAAAQSIATADLPTSSAPDPTDPFSPKPPTMPADLAGRFVTLTTAADMHHVTAAALRSAVSMYRDSLDLVRPTPVD